MPSALDLAFDREHLPPVGIIASSRIKIPLDSSTTHEIHASSSRVRAVEGQLPSGRQAIVITRSHPDEPKPPHMINNADNLNALRELGARQVFATGMVGTLVDEVAPGAIVVPDQLVDLTFLAPTVFPDSRFGFADVTSPYCANLRAALGSVAETEELIDGGTYFSMRGPRYETAAEARMLRMLGGTIVGATGGAEAIAARELGLCYASLTFVTNWGANLSNSVVVETVAAAANRGSERLGRILVDAADTVEENPACTCRTPLTMFGRDA